MRLCGVIRCQCQCTQHFPRKHAEYYLFYWKTSTGVFNADAIRLYRINPESIARQMVGIKGINRIIKTMGRSYYLDVFIEMVKC